MLKKMVQTSQKILRLIVGTSSLPESVFSMGLSRLVNLALALAFSIVIARVLGPHNKGIYNAVMLVASLYIAILNMGVGQGNFYYLAKGKCSTEMAYTHTFLLTIGSGCLAILIAVTTGWPVLNVLLPGIPRELITLALILGFLQLFTTLSNDILRGKGFAQATYVIPLIAQIPTLVVALIMFYFGIRLEGLLMATLLSSVLTVMASYFGVRSRARLRWSFSWSVFWQSLRYGIPFYIVGIVLFTQSRLDQFLTARMLGTAALGQYALAVVWAEMLWSLDSPIVAAAQYHVASRADAESIQLVNRMTRSILVLQFFACVAMSIGGYLIIPWLYGKAFSPTVGPLLAYLPGVLFWSGARCVSQYTSYQRGRPDINFWLLTSGAVIELLAALILMPSFGMTGIALASSISYFWVFIWNAVVYLQWSKSTIKEALIPTIDDLAFVEDMFLRFAGNLNRKINHAFPE